MHGLKASQAGRKNPHNANLSDSSNPVMCGLAHRGFNELGRKCYGKIQGRAGQDIHHILREAIPLAQPRESPGAGAHRGGDAPGSVHSWTHGVGMSRGRDEPGSGCAGARERRDPPGGTRGHSRCRATAPRPARARPTLTRGRPRAPIGCLRKVHGSHWASAASAASPLAHRPLPTPRHFLTPFPPPGPPAARRAGGGI